MLSVPLGPLALPVAPLLLLAAVWLAAALARRGAGIAAENVVWIAAGLGLLAARAGHLLRHADAYAASPAAMLDLRDGGFWAAPGWTAAGLWLAWRAASAPPLRRALGAAALAGVALWGGTSLLLDRVSAGGDAALPAIDLAGLNDGRLRPLPELAVGQPTVINLWASWCGPCRAEMPMLAAAQQRERGIRFLFVNQGESAATVQAYLRREGLALDGVWLDPASRAGPAFGSRGLPTTLFIDAAGRRVDAHFGVLNAAALKARLNALNASR
ncbi:MAG: TlpA family protein disulfide reductase [Burkholderiaceae bacterium]|nr:TlpA family protein disulfide reductase [Burkholderiaceae bacterium]